MKHLILEQISTFLKENTKTYQTEELFQREKFKCPTSRPCKGGLPPFTKRATQCPFTMFGHWFQVH